MNSTLLQLTERDVFAAFSVAGSTDFMLYLQSEETIHPITFSKRGFVVHPFVISEDHDSYFISADCVYENPDFQFTTDQITEATVMSREEYLVRVHGIVEELSIYPESKVVFSRAERHNVPSAKWHDVFKRLVSSQKEAFVFMINAPGRGTWIGASPESLLNKENSSLQVSFLAGTMPINGVPLETMQWSSKDLLEHQIVADYFKEELEDLPVSYDSSPRRTVKASTVAHLKSLYNIKENVEIDKVTARLHPNPAILGYPVEKAKSIINEYELMDRGYYCGYVGPVEADKALLYVNLRSMQCFKNSALLYAGGGILSTSNPEKEWKETEMKMDVMRNAINPQ